MQFYAGISKETVFLKKDRIQAFEYRQSPLHRKLKIGKIKASILNNFMGQHYVLNGLSIKDIEEISTWYSYRDTYSLADVGLDQTKNSDLL